MTAQREWFEKDYYKTLGVSDGATQKEITKACLLYTSRCV